MLEIKQAVEKAGLAEWDLLLELRKKRKCMSSGSTVCWEEYREASFHCGEKIHMAKAQLELKLGSSVGVYK